MSELCVYYNMHYWTATRIHTLNTECNAKKKQENRKLGQRILWMKFVSLVVTGVKNNKIDELTIGVRMLGLSIFMVLSRRRGVRFVNFEQTEKVTWLLILFSLVWIIARAL